MAERQRQIIIPPPVPGTQEYYIQERLNRDLLPYEKQLGMVRDNSYRYEYKAHNSEAMKYGSWIYLLVVFFLGLFLSCSYVPEPTKPIVLNLSFGVETETAIVEAISLTESGLDNEIEAEEIGSSDNHDNNDMAINDILSNSEPQPEQEPEMAENTSSNYDNYLESISNIEINEDQTASDSSTNSADVAQSLSDGIMNAVNHNGSQIGSGRYGSGNDMDYFLAKAGAQAGEVQISLMWNTYDDIDLHVMYYRNHGVTENINWQNRMGRISGGILDIDMNAQGPMNNVGIENIFWPYGSSPRGFFVVGVQFFHSWTGNRTVPVMVRVKKGETEEFFKAEVYLGTSPTIVTKFKY